MKLISVSGPHEGVVRLSGMSQKEKIEDFACSCMENKNKNYISYVFLHIFPTFVQANQITALETFGMLYQTRFSILFAEISLSMSLW